MPTEMGSSLRGHPREWVEFAGDTGIGILKAALGPISRSSGRWTVATRAHGGTGLGLPSAAGRPNAGGDHCREREGKGSTFVFSIPAARESRARAEPQAPTAETQPRPGEKLVSASTTIPMWSTCSRRTWLDAGYRVIGAGSGEEVERRAGFGRAPSLDIVMPEPTAGKCFTREDRPLIRDILSSSSRLSTRRNRFSAGRRRLRCHRSTVRPDHRSVVGGWRILVVDDDRTWQAGPPAAGGRGVHDRLRLRRHRRARAHRPSASERDPP
jgi:hypothetical protein